MRVLMTALVACALATAVAVPVTASAFALARQLLDFARDAQRGRTERITYALRGRLGGGMLGGNLMHGLIHPEMGHMRLPHDWDADPFPGICPYHGDCLEGMAAGPAIQARWGQPAQTLPADHPAWPLQAHYLALALANLICTLSPQRIILGGGVMNVPLLFPLVRREVQDLLNGYVQAPEILDQIDCYIVPPRLASRAGVLGALALAEAAASTQQ